MQGLEKIGQRVLSDTKRSRCTLDEFICVRGDGSHFGGRCEESLIRTMRCLQLGSGTCAQQIQPRLGEGPTPGLAGASLRGSCHGLLAAGVVAAAGGDVVALEDADFDMLKAAIEHPNQVAGAPMAPEAARQYIPFLSAIMKASDKAIKSVKETS